MSAVCNFTYKDLLDLFCFISANSDRKTGEANLITAVSPEDK